MKKVSGNNGGSIKAVPAHIAIIMDGNGRWAQRRGHARIFGHRKGAKVVREVTEECASLGVERLTLFAFSSDNWKRPTSEVSNLMKLLKRYLINERRTIMKNNIRLLAIGRTGALPEFVQEELANTIEMSAKNSGMTLCLSLNYGGMNEIVDACRKAAKQVEKGELDPADITESTLQRFFYDPAMPPVDLLIRTAGEYRISNFLLWHLAYAEIYVSKFCWPEFTRVELHNAIREFTSRERKFGGIIAQ